MVVTHDGEPQPDFFVEIVKQAMVCYGLLLAKKKQENANFGQKVG